VVACQTAAMGVSRHFGARTLRTYQTGAEVSSGHFGTGIGTVSTSRKHLAPTGRTEERFNVTHYY